MPTAPLAQIRGLTLVLVGDFNPTIFQPRWFSSEGILTDEEARAANVQVIHPDVTVFDLEWIHLTVQRDRLNAACLAQPYFERVVAVVCRAFELLKHTPLRMAGINNEAHFRASSPEKWHAFGHKLAPKDFWSKFFENPGMQTLEIRQVPRLDKKPGFQQVRIEPSTRFNPGVFVLVNDHFDNNSAAALGADAVVSHIQEHWANAQLLADAVFKRIADEL